MNKSVLVILGPTACGKTHLATQLAYRVDGEIISADSRQVYQGMDIGTGKDLNEYLVKGKKIPSHLIDIVPAGHKYLVADFQQDALTAIDLIHSRNQQAIVCGGSGMYIQALINNYAFTQVPNNITLRKILDTLSDETLREKTAPLTHQFPHFDQSTRKRMIRILEINDYFKENPMPNTADSTHSFTVVGIDIEREERRNKITNRLKERIDGIIEETQSLLQQGVKEETLLYYGLEYKYAIHYLNKKMNKQAFFEQLETGIHQFAKRQMTYFRKMERDGIAITWMPASLSLDDKLSFLEEKTRRL